MANRDLLAGLISGEVSKLSTSAPEYRDIPLEQLHDNPKNFFPVDEGSVRQLAESIQISGIQQPPIVTPAESGGYRIVSGHRRTAAIKLLHQEHPEDKRWESITCRITKYASAAEEELALIVTNTEVRTQTWRWASQASKRTEELLIQLQEQQGIKLPGRTRDRVAGILKISKAKLGRAQYIDKHLIEPLRRKWPDLSELVANKLAHMTTEQQLEISTRCRSRSCPCGGDVDKWEESYANGVNPFDAADAARAAEKKRKAAEGPKRQCKMSGTGYIPIKECDKNRNSCDKNNCCWNCSLQHLCDTKCTLVSTYASSNPTYALSDTVSQRLALIKDRLVGDKHIIGKIAAVGLNYQDLIGLIDLAKDNYISMDYLLGLTDYPSLGWRPITPTEHPPEGAVVVVATYSDDQQKWVVSRVSWHNVLYNSGAIQKWMPLPQLD